MTQNNKMTEEIEAYEKKPVEDLTVNEALILVLLCAGKENRDSSVEHTDLRDHIAALVQNHPVFSDCVESIEPIINKFMNYLETKKDLIKPVQKAVDILSPELRKTVFGWVVKIIAPDGVLSKERKTIFDKYALLLKIEKNVAQKIILEVSKDS